MAAGPITLFSHKVDPAGVLRVLRELAPNLRLTGNDEQWQQIVIAGKAGIFRKADTITFNHDPQYYTGLKWDQQLAGMRGYFRQFRQNENTDRVMLLIQSFRFALAVIAEPEIDIDSSDERLKYIFAVARHLDAAIFMPTSLRDASGRVLISADQDPDSDATMPAIYKHVSAGPRDALPISQGGAKLEAKMKPPTSQRVAQRACALAALTGRALLEREDANDPAVEVTRRRIVDWIEATGIGGELEPDEWKVVQRPCLKLSEQEAVNSVWRLEGLGILAWALNLFDLLPADQLVDPGKLLPAIGILNVNRTESLLASPQLRTPEEMERLSHQLFAVHWRLRNFQLKPEAMNFAEFAKTAWFGPLRIEKVRLIDGDLAIGDRAISAAPEESVRAAQSAASERHVAINWLRGRSQIYSETDDST